MSVCFTATPSGASKAFVYSLLGDNEPHMTGVGGPVTLETEDLTRERPSADPILVEPETQLFQESRENCAGTEDQSQEVNCLPEEPGDPKKDISSSATGNESVKPIDKPDDPKKDFSSSATENESVKPIEEPGDPKKDLSSSASENESVKPIEEPGDPKKDLSSSASENKNVKLIEEPGDPKKDLSSSTTENESVKLIEEPGDPKKDLSSSATENESVKPIEEPGDSKKDMLSLTTKNESVELIKKPASCTLENVEESSEQVTIEADPLPVESESCFQKPNGVDSGCTEVTATCSSVVQSDETVERTEENTSISDRETMDSGKQHPVSCDLIVKNSTDDTTVETHSPDSVKEEKEPEVSLVDNKRQIAKQHVSDVLSELKAIHVQISKESESLSQSTDDLLDSRDDSLSPVAVHNTSSDSSDLYVTAANSDGCDSVPTVSGDSLAEEDHPGWSSSPTADVQPDSLEEEVDIGSSDQGGYFSVDRSLPVFVLEEGCPASLGSRTPKKLFRDDDEDDRRSLPTTDDLSLKDLEGRSLREMERERRRIIDNQTVRRKKVDYWAFATGEDRPQASSGPASAPPDTSGHKVRGNWPPTPPASPVPRNPVVAGLGRVSPGSLPRGWSPPSCVVRSVSPPVTPARSGSPSSCSSPRRNSSAAESSPPASPARTPSPAVYAPLPWTGRASSPTAPAECQASPAGQHRTQGVQGHSVDAEPLPGSVDCASILENKERLRLFWERRIMAEQENGPSGDGTAEVQGNETVSEPSPPDSLNEAPGSAGAEAEATAPQTEEIQQALPEPEVKVEQSEVRPKEEEVASGSALESGAEESELCPSRQEVSVEQPSVEAPTNVEPSTQHPESEVKVSGDESDKPGIENAAVEETGAPLKISTHPAEEQKEESEEGKVATEEQKVEQETASSKPQIIGETYQITNETNPEPAAVEPSVTGVQTPPASVQPAALPTPRSERPQFNPAADSKIAQEIQEMQAREEELRRMRELALQQQNTPENGAVLSDSGGSVHSDEGRSSPVDTASDKPAGYVGNQLEGLQGQTVYNQGYAFGHRRKESIKVKPLADEEDRTQSGQESASTFPVLKESPIEREIRLAREREEELRKEKGGSVDQSEAGLQRPTSLLANGGGPWRGLVNGKGSTKDTQRFLATTRIQQEIVEQTEREMALRASGMIQTISQERTDAKVTRLRDVTLPTEKQVLLQLSSSPPASPAHSSSASDSEKSGPGPLTNGNTNGHHPKTPSPSGSLSGQQVDQGVTNGVGRRFNNTPQVRGVSMQRFIASKGRELSFTAFGPAISPKSSPTTPDPGKVSPKEGPRSLGSIVVSPVGTNGTPAAPVTKRCVTAEVKIQDELKEMQAREDELKQQRARLLGLSQPNLSILTGEDDLQVSNGHHSPQREGNNKLDGMDRASSNPNLLDDDEQYDDDEKISVGGPRRRSMLIDQWEKRIQKKEDVKTT